ncbi:MAG: hypothetical protein AABZ53_10275 [Planctomycetota bacterium]
MNSPAHQCPRCDYDLSGQIAAWAGECPLTGQCPECGLEIRWTEIFNTIPPPAWSFEHAKGSINALAGSLIRSWIRVLFPGHLWSRLTLGLKTVPTRLFQLAGLGLLLSHLAASLFTAFLILADHLYYRDWPLPAPPGRITSINVRGSGRAQAALLHDWLSWAFPYANVTRVGRGTFDVPLGAVEILLAFAVLIPLSFFLLPTTMRRAKVRPAHIFRIAAYWSLCVPLLGLIAPTLRHAQVIASLEWYRVTVSPGTHHDHWTRVASAFLSRHFASISLVLILLFAWWFWSTAAKRYLRLPWARLDTAILVLLALWAALAGEFLISSPNNSTTMELLKALTAPSQ